MSLLIELPEDLHEFVVRQASCEGFASSEEYIIELLVREWRRVSEDRLIARLQEGIDSGDPVEFTPEWWSEERTRMQEGDRS